MAVFDGFFDAYYNEETGEYDRAYDSGDFTQYFGQIIGSGVCVTEDPDSCKVRLAGNQALVNLGYLFIRGYWLKVADEPYAVDLTGTGPLAVIAYLNTGKKMIELEAAPAAESYPADTLVLAVVDPAAGTVEDTRYDTGVCGVIDSLSELSDKAAYAIEYIENEIGPKFEQIEADIKSQEEQLDKEIEAVSKVVEKIAPLPVGTIKFSANPDMGKEWLRCDGRFISEEDYPELTMLLRGETGGANIYELTSWLIDSDVNIGAFFGGYYWTVSTYIPTGVRKIYRVSLNDGTVTEIQYSIDNGSNMAFPVSLSIVEIGGKPILYIVISTSSKMTYENNVWTSTPQIQYLYCDNFNVESTSIQLKSRTVVFDNPTHGTTVLNYETTGPSGSVYPEVAVFNSVPYVPLNANIWSDYPFDKTGNGISKTVSRIILWASLNVGSEKIFQYEVDYTTTTTYLDSTTLKTLFPERTMYRTVFSAPRGSKFGGLYLPSNEVREIRGNTTALWGRGLSGTTAWGSTLTVPAISPNYILIDVLNYKSVSTGGNMRTNIKLIGINGSTMGVFATELPDTENIDLFSFSYSRTYTMLYIEEFDLFAVMIPNGVMFTKDPTDSQHYVIVNTSEVLGVFRQDRISPTMKYDEIARKLYFLWGTTNYHVHIGVMELPPNFDPINGTNLPTLSLNSVPAYIKAKPTDSEEAAT